MTIGTADGSEIVTEKSILFISPGGLSGFEGDPATYTYQWFRSGVQADALYEPSQDIDPSTPTERYNVNKNGRNDVGHRFYLQVTDGSGHTAASNIEVATDNAFGSITKS